ncbi:hypothetical protein BHYA_0131g00120 [Botrytis hyacinthi]|uniref:Cytochrome P450 n=1 Tax=Botrytis hyacinthi TaxID=278943 RepID=A0A4Z1GGZ6_9HELO|nr:hypothetical protein BHYA_0131g00120 [Botrytis hyacinthi]
MIDFAGSHLSLTLLLTYAAISLYPAATVIYNLCFHPLRKFPGPILWRSSQLPYIISLVRGNPVLDQMKIHKKYGDVIRLAPNEIIFHEGRSLE